MSIEPEPEEQKCRYCGAIYDDPGSYSDHETFCRGDLWKRIFSSIWISISQNAPNMDQQIKYDTANEHAKLAIRKIEENK